MRSVSLVQFILVVSLISLVTPLLAGNIDEINMARSRFFVDYATFAGEDENRLEVYYKIFNDGLNYVKKGDKYVANYEINVIIVGEGDKQITGQSVDKTYVLGDYSLTRSSEGYLINQIDLGIQPGEYALLCRLIDHNSNHVSTIESKFKAPPFDRNADLSDVEFIQQAEPMEDDSHFTKNGFTVLPAVERVYDSEDQNLGFFVEAYLAGFGDDKASVVYEIADSRNGTVLTDTIPLSSGSDNVSVKRFQPLKDFPPGDYDLLLTLKKGSRPVAQRTSDFIIKWSLASMIKNDFDYAVDQLKYIMSKDEKEGIYEAPDSLRLQEFEKFWKSKDPSPGTPENELREEYYRRIRYANQYYRALNREGWQTDRGMIYVKHGEPDQIDRHPFELDTKPYQIWHYYSQRLRFVFQDNRGDGDYQLQYPYDGDWRRYIGP